jgi:8-oxo-dGTP pyrophosphatase MutT (NUDIX family)
VRRTFDFDWFRVKWLAGYGWILERRPAVVVVPIAPDDRMWFIRLNRIPTGTTSWEFPGGGVDDGEDPVLAGLRELEEESSLTAKGKVRLLDSPLHLAPGMGPFPHHVVVARDVSPRGARPVAQKEEGIVAVRRFDRATVRKMLRRGAINVQATLAALLVSGWLEQDGPKPRRRRT